MRALPTRLILFLLFLTGCNESEGPVGTSENLTQNPRTQSPRDPDGNQDTPNPSTPPVPRISKLRWYPQYIWKNEWSKAMIAFVEDTTLTDVPLLQSDLNLLGCPNYNRASAFEKNQFWIVMMASISAIESAFNPQTRYYEAPLNEWSEGLLQLSISNRKPSGGCAGINSRTILQPLPNLRCGLDIMERQIQGNQKRGRKRGSLFPNPAYYWSTLTNPKTRPKVIEFFGRHLNQLKFCLDY